MLWAAGVAGALSTLWALMKKVRKRTTPFFHGLSKALLVLNGRDAVMLPENGVVIQPALPGVLERLDTVEGNQAQMLGQVCEIMRKVEEIEHEVKPNNGSSIKDSVGRIEERLSAGDERFDRLEASITTSAEAQRAMWPAIEAVAKGIPPEDLIDDEVEPDLD